MYRYLQEKKLEEKNYSFWHDICWAAILADRGRHLPFWQLACHYWFGTGFANPFSHFLDIFHIAESTLCDSERFRIAISHNRTNHVHLRIENHPTHHSLSLSYTLILHSSIDKSTKKIQRKFLAFF
jgi:hypothetical protein